MGILFLVFFLVPAMTRASPVLRLSGDIGGDAAASFRTTLSAHARDAAMVLLVDMDLSRPLPRADCRRTQDGQRDLYALEDEICRLSPAEKTSCQARCCSGASPVRHPSWSRSPYQFISSRIFDWLDLSMSGSEDFPNLRVLIALLMASSVRRSLESSTITVMDRIQSPSDIKELFSRIPRELKED